MTSKQFMQLLEYFFKSITGRELQALAGKGDLYDGIIRVLKNMDCPFMINKSMLRTPNTPHTFDQMIVLLLWLGDFTSPYDDNPGASSKYMHDEDLPSHAYTEIFSRAAMDGFQLWNRESDEFVVLQDHLVDRHIAETVGNGIECGKEVMDMCGKLIENSAELRALSTAIPSQQYVEELESKYVAAEDKLHTMTTARIELTNRLGESQKQWDAKNHKMNVKRSECNALKESIRRQEHTIAEYNQLGEEIALHKATTDIEKVEIDNLKGVESSNAINRARLLHQLVTVIPEVTKKLDAIVACINGSQLNLDINVLNALSIDSSIAAIKLPHLEKINSWLTKIDACVQGYLNEIQLHDDHTKIKVNTLKKEKSLLARQIEVVGEKYKKYLSDMEIIEGVLKMNETKLQNFVGRMNGTAKTYQIEYEQRRDEAALMRQTIAHLEKECREAMVQGEQGVKDRVRQRNEVIAQMVEIEDFLDAEIDSLRGNTNDS